MSHDLSKVPTRVLLKWLNDSKKYRNNDDVCIEVYSHAKPWSNIDGCRITIKEIKQELSNRPHVPNKTESKKVRQEKAKQSKNFSKKKG